MKKLIEALMKLKVETGSLACLGCGHENSCSIRGCAIIHTAIEEMSRLQDRNLKIEEQLYHTKQCVAGLSMLEKAIDGKMQMEKVLPMGRRRLEQYREEYPSAKVVLDESDDNQRSTHELKLKSSYYNASLINAKTFEIRKNDRNFKVGDVLKLVEVSSETQEITGKFHCKQITYILDNAEYLKEGYVCLGLRPTK